MQVQIIASYEKQNSKIVNKFALSFKLYVIEIDTYTVSTCLDVRWVQEDSDRSTESLSWQVRSECSSNDTGVTVCSVDLTPDHSDLGTSDFLGASVDIGDSLTQVELSVFWVGNTFNLDQRDVWVVNALGSLV